MMQYEKKILRCAASNVTEKDLISSLEKSNYFIEGSTLAGIEKEKDEYVATIFSPITASRPYPPDDNNAEDDSLPKPKAEGSDSESPSEESSSDSSEKSDKPKDDSPSESKSESKPKSDSPFGDKGEGESGGNSEILGILHEILNLLAQKGPAGPPGIGAGGPPGPPAGPPAAPKPPMAGPPQTREVIHRRGLKPGEAPPGTMPLGAPAFSSTQTNQSISIDKLGHIQAFADARQGTVEEAYRDLMSKYGPYGFKVRQINKVDGKYAALLTP